MGHNVSALIQSRNVSAISDQPLIPPKCKDPGTFTVPCTIGTHVFPDALLDLGAAINVMPLSVYKTLNVGSLEPTGIVVQLANKSLVQPLGILEDVLVRVSDLIFPADFFILDMQEGHSVPTLILGRPFLKTAHTKIDVHAGTLSMEFGDHAAHFTIPETMHPHMDYSVSYMESLDIPTELFTSIDAATDVDISCACDGPVACPICAEINQALYGDAPINQDHSTCCDTSCLVCAELTLAIHPVSVPFAGASHSSPEVIVTPTDHAQIDPEEPVAELIPVLFPDLPPPPPPDIPPLARSHTAHATARMLGIDEPFTDPSLAPTPLLDYRRLHPP